jgi:hypothetical protein
MGKKSRGKRAKQLERDRKKEGKGNLSEVEDPVAGGRAFAASFCGCDLSSAYLDSPLARFVASKYDLVKDTIVVYKARGAELATQWDALSDAEKAAFAPPSSSSPRASTSRVSEVPPDHDTPAAAAKPSSVDAHDGEPASTAVNASASTVTEKLCAFGVSCMQRLSYLTFSPGASTSRVTGPAEEEEVTPDHYDTPAAAMPSSDTVSTSDSTTALAEKLLAFCQSCTDRLGDDIKTWVDGEFSGDIDAVKDAAERGDAKAQYAIGFLKIINCTPGGVLGISWLCNAAVQAYADAILAMGVFAVNYFVGGKCEQGDEEASHIVAKKTLTMSAVEHNSAEAHNLMGMLDCIMHGCARSKPDMLETARWFRMAAHQRLDEAQWELGEWFRRGLFCEVHMGFARKYIRRASKQGPAAALDRMSELRRCVNCGADAAARKCKLCLEARYCDAACAARHWRGGGGCGGYDAPHKTACSRTHADDGAGSDSGGGGE